MRIGIDLVDIKRMTPNIENFILTESEQEYVNKFTLKNEHIAGFFAVKEAIIKALDMGGEGVNFKDIEISHTKSGKPFIKELKNKFKEKFLQIEEKNIDISISHEKNMANAVVLFF